MQVLFVVTGDLEQQALHLALRNTFPQVPATVFLTPAKTLSMTSARLGQYPLPGGVRPIAKQIAVRLVTELTSRRQPDYVFVLDDLELHNHDQPASVVQYFRSALSEVLDETTATLGQISATRLRNKVSERCSLHFFSPMLEAYFFTNMNSLVRTGVDPTKSLFDPGLDCEHFNVNDPEIIESSCRHPRCNHPFCRHPKNYLSHLGGYSEIGTAQGGGFAALSNMDLRLSLQASTHAAYARSFLADLADAIGVTPPIGELASETSRKHGGILRNVA